MPKVISDLQLIACLNRLSCCNNNESTLFDHVPSQLNPAHIFTTRFLSIYVCSISNSPFYVMMIFDFCCSKNPGEPWLCLEVGHTQSLQFMCVLPCIDTSRPQVPWKWAVFSQFSMFYFPSCKEDVCCPWKGLSFVTVPPFLLWTKTQCAIPIGPGWAPICYPTSHGSEWPYLQPAY
jgi:hypothetical protein